MNEVYKAMQALKCTWNQVNNYRVLCLWKYTAGILPKARPFTDAEVRNLYFLQLQIAMVILFINA